MRKIPAELNANNKETFTELRNLDILEKICEDVCNFLIHRTDENEYIDLDKYYIRYGKLCFPLVEKIITQLNELNWKTKLSFGDSGLFIYSTEDPPRSCW